MCMGNPKKIYRDTSFDQSNNRVENSGDHSPSIISEDYSKDPISEDYSKDSNIDFSSIIMNPQNEDQFLTEDISKHDTPMGEKSPSQTQEESKMLERQHMFELPSPVTFSKKSKKSGWKKVRFNRWIILINMMILIILLSFSSFASH